MHTRMPFISCNIFYSFNSTTYVQITDVVTAADRDAAARAAAVTLDDEEPEPVVPEPTPTDMDDDVQITDVVTAAHRDAAARAAAVTLDDEEDDQKPEPVIPKPVKSEVFDLTEEEDPGGIIASAMGGDDQSPVVPAGGDDHPMQADKPVNDLTSFLYHVPEPVVDLTQTQTDDPGGVMLEPLAPLDPMNPNQPDNILRQQPGGEDQPMDEDGAQGGDDDMDEDGAQSQCTATFVFQFFFSVGGRPMSTRFT